MVMLHFYPLDSVCFVILISSGTSFELDYDD